MINSKTQFKILIIILCLVGSVEAATTGIFDSIVNSFSSQAVGWTTKNKDLATKIFWMISFVEFTYQAAFKKLLPGEVQKLWVWVISRCFIIYLLSEFVLDINVYTGIINWLIARGNDLGGTSGITSSEAGIINYSVSGLWDQLWSLWSPTVYVLFTATGVVGAFSGPAGIFFLSLAGAILFIMFMIVIVVVLTMVEMYLIVFAGSFLTCFMGSSWTKNYWEKYLTYSVAVGVRLMFTCIILGIESKQWANASSWLTPMSTGDVTGLDSIGSILSNLMIMLGTFLLDMVLLMTIPSKAASLLNGAVSAGLGEAIGAASMGLSGGKALAAPVAAAGGSAVGLAKTLMSAPAAAKTAAFSAMRGALKNNIGGASSGNTSQFRQALKSIGKNAASNSMKQGASNLGSTLKNKWAGVGKSTGSGLQGAAMKASSGDSSHGGGSVNINPHN